MAMLSRKRIVSCFTMDLCTAKLYTGHDVKLKLGIHSIGMIPILANYLITENGFLALEFGVKLIFSVHKAKYLGCCDH